MHIGLVGLGKMGGNMRTRLRAAGIEVTGYAPDPATTDVESLEALVAALPAPRTVWVMVPSGDITRQTVASLGELLVPRRPGHRRRELPLHRRPGPRGRARARRASATSTAASPAGSGA